MGIWCESKNFLKKVSFPRPNLPLPFTKTFIFHLIATAIRWNRKQVWKGLGGGEGKNLSLKGFHFSASKVFQTFAIPLG